MSHWSSAYAESVTKHMAQALLVTTRDFQVLHANPKAVALLGADSEKALQGLSLFGRGMGGEGIAIDPPFRKNGGPGLNGRYHVHTPWREDLEVDIEFLPGDTAAGTALVLISEIPSGQQFDNIFYQSEKLAAMDNIVAGVAHELNNPMTAILGYAELLLATERSPKRKHRIGLIAEEADRCGKIIGNMLSFTRSFGNEFEEGNVAALLEEVVSLRAYQMRVDGIEIYTETERGMALSLLQPSAIRRLFLNILHNAHQALLEVPEGEREFWASAKSDGDIIRVEIADSGPGITEDVRYKIFDPFFTTRALGEGMGLGLSVAYGVVHEHHGKIWMEPREPRGTRILMEFPVRIIE